MRRADRLFQIIQLLRGNRMTTAKGLSEALEVSKRTIYRDIADLKSTGVPIDGEPGIGYILRPGHDIPPLMFTQEEVLAIVAGTRLISAWGGFSMAKAAQEAMIKIEAVLPPAIQEQIPNIEIHAPTQLNAKQRIQLDDISQSIKEKTSLDITYSDSKSQCSDRTVRPLAIWFWGKVWTLAAWCEMRQDFRLFRTDRIEKLTVTGSHFQLEKGKTLRDYYKTLEQKGELMNETKESL